MNFHPRPRHLLIITGLVVVMVSGGCATVTPWQRGNLADVLMQPDADPLHIAMNEHIFFSREASSGGRAVGGGGCGCN